MIWRWPLVGVTPYVPVGDHAGAFAAKRKHDIHTGVDLYCRRDDFVVAVEDGEIVAIEWFTGIKAGSPWWHPTECVMVEGASGVVLYGEIEPMAWKVGQRIQKGQLVGLVRRVLKKDKGLPTTMLHLELYAPGTVHSTWWYHGELQPRRLLDPTSYLLISREHLLAGLDTTILKP